MLDFIIDVANNLYDLFLKLLTVLDSDIRINVFIGVTSLMIATIIFIAEIVSQKEYQLEKALILDNTKMIRNMFFSVAILFSLFATSALKSSYSDVGKLPYFENDILFFVINLMLDIFIVIFMIETIKMFVRTIGVRIDL